MSSPGLVSPGTLRRGLQLDELDPVDVVRTVRGRGGDPLAAAVRHAAIRAAAEATQRGWRAGHSAGWDAGHLEGLRAARSEVDRALAALVGAADDFERRAATDLDTASRTIALAALELAEAVIGRELAVAADPGADAMARALALVPNGHSVVRLHPDDAALLSPSAVPAGGRLTVEADPRVERGGCVLVAGATTIDAQIGSAVARARAALAGEDES